MIEIIIVSRSGAERERASTRGVVASARKQDPLPFLERLIGPDRSREVVQVQFCLFCSMIFGVDGKESEWAATTHDRGACRLVVW